MTSVSNHRTLSVGSSGGSSCTYGSPVKSPLLLHRLCLSDAVSILSLVSACEVALGFSSVSLIDLQVCEPGLSKEKTGRGSLCAPTFRRRRPSLNHGTANALHYLSGIANEM